MDYLNESKSHLTISEFSDFRRINSTRSKLENTLGFGVVFALCLKKNPEVLKFGILPFLN